YGWTQARYDHSFRESQRRNKKQFPSSGKDHRVVFPILPSGPVFQHLPGWEENHAQAPQGSGRQDRIPLEGRRYGRPVHRRFGIDIFQESGGPRDKSTKDPRGHGIHRFSRETEGFENHDNRRTGWHRSVRKWSPA